MPAGCLSRKPFAFVCTSPVPSRQNFCRPLPARADIGNKLNSDYESVKTTPRTCRYWAKGTYRPLPGKLYQRLCQAHADHILQALSGKTALPPFTQEEEKELELLFLFSKLPLFHFLGQSLFPGQLRALEERLRAPWPIPRPPFLTCAGRNKEHCRASAEPREAFRLWGLSWGGGSIPRGRQYILGAWAIP